jgi:hypothetical protein
VLRRAAADWPVLIAAFATILLATVLLAAAPIYSEAVAKSGLRRTLADAAPTRVNAEVAARLGGEEYAAADRLVARHVADAFASTQARLYRSGLSDSYELGPERNIAVLAFYDDLAEHATLVAGAWAGAGEAALPEGAAAALEVEPGSEVELEGTALRIVGVYRPDDAADPFWWQRPLEVEGVERGDFTTWGPFVVPRETFFELAESGARARGRGAPAFDALDVGEVPGLRERVSELETRLNEGRRGSHQFFVETDLSAVLEGTERSLLVARSGVLIPSVQLAILAAAALLFTAGLLVEGRSLEAAILRSRGGAANDIAVLAAMEGALLALPAAAAAPWIAAFSLRSLNHVGPLAAVELELDPHVGPEAYAFALLAALACVGALALPALRSGTVTASVAERGRTQERTLFHRAGLDLVLLAVALVAYWQLRRYGAPIVESVQGRIGVDPFLIAAPALGLLAGAVVALRAVPAAARAGERVLATARGVVSALGPQQVARRPRRYARSALLLVLALAIGIFAAAYGQTWVRSQTDQADFEAGADVRVVPSQRSGSLAQIRLAPAYAALPGVRTAVPLVTESLELSQAAGVGEILALDARRAGGVVAFRTDLAETPLSRLLAPLAGRRPEPAAIELQGRPRRLAFDVGVEIDPIPPDLDLPVLVTDLRPSFRVVLQDANGLLFRLPGSDIRPDGKERRYVVELDRPAYPVQLVSIELTVEAPFQLERTAVFTVAALEASDGARRPWQPVDVGPARWSVDITGLRSAERAPRVLEVAGPVLRVRVATGATAAAFGGRPAVTFAATPGRNRLPQALPAVVTRDFLRRTQTQVGEVVPLAGSEQQAIEVVGSVRGFPTVDPDEAVAIVVDLPTYQAVTYFRTRALPRPTEWLLDVAPGRSAEVARRLAGPPFLSAEVVDRLARARSLTSDPVAVGISGALSLGFAAAAVFAVVGFAVAAAVSTRERTTEFAILRSLGLSSRQLSGALALEAGLTVVLSVAGGVLLGIVLAWFVLPYVSLTGSGERAFPAVVVQMPWLTALWVVLGLLAVLALVVGVQVRLLGRLRLAPALRAGEDR